MEMIALGTEIIPEGYGNSDGDVADLDVLTQKVGRQISPEELVEASNNFSLAPKDLYGDNELSVEAFKQAEKIFAQKTPEEKKLTSVGAIATTIIQRLKQAKLAEQKRGELKMPSTPKPKASSTAVTPPARRRRKRKTQTTTEPAKQSRLTRVKSTSPPPVADFSALRIIGLSEKPFEADVTVILQRLVANQPIEDVLTGHWVTVRENSRGQIVELDLICDRRDESCELPSDLQLEGSSTMRVVIAVDDEESEFEAVQAMFQTQFGVFQMYKFLAAYDE